MMGSLHDQVVVVTGDVTVDWHLARRRTSRYSTRRWNADDTTSASCQRGGAALLGALTAALATDAAGGHRQIDVRRTGGGGEAVLPGDDRFHHSYALWSQFDNGKDASAVGRRAPRSAWRIEEFLGLDRSPRTGAEAAGSWTTVNDDPPRADVIVLDDAALGFRARPELWPAGLGAAVSGDPRGERPWVLLKMECPVAEGALWDRLQAAADRLVVVMTIDDLRLSDVQISRGLSWERTAQDLMWELVHNPRVNALSRCAHVVVSFDVAGALLLTSDVPSRVPGMRSWLYFDPEVVEGTWTARHPGGILGATSSLAAGIVGELLANPELPDVGRGIQRGLTAARVLHLHGYAAGDADPPRVALEFPIDTVVTTLRREPDEPFVVQEVEDPATAITDPAATNSPRRRHGSWTMLSTRYGDGLERVAFDAALRGPETTLDDVPVGRFGKLLTVDRQEMESFRAIGGLVLEYARQPRPERPLSLAAFGPPGAGKSFGIVQVVTSLMPDRIKKLTFNLSQFDRPRELTDALHQVRDVALTGRLPLVFWDEFDTALDGADLGWLRHFLAPMQDGSFQEGQIVHPIGPAIFVFAGGTRWTMADFAAPTTDEFRQAKGPDFVSRLKGYVDILGPNPRPNAAQDPSYLIRRAILLRSMLRRDHADLFHRNDGAEVLNIDPGVLKALLLTRWYKHGSRSMESILAMSQLAGRRRYERSSLPTGSQLELHVDAEEFLSLVRSLELGGELLERLAEANHVLYCAAMLEAGHGWAGPTDEYLLRHEVLKQYAGRAGGGKPHDTLVAYDDLSDSDRRQNRGAVRDIPDKLAAAGFVMRPAGSDDAPFDFPGPDLEVLAEQEHDRWMRAKLADGWRYGERKDVEQLTHPALVAWTTCSPDEVEKRFGPGTAKPIGAGPLPEAEREKDREAVRRIPQVLAAAGYTVVRLSPDEPRPA